MQEQGSEHHKVSQKVVIARKNSGVNMMPFEMLVIMLAQTNSMCPNLPSVKTQMMQKVWKCLHCAILSTIMRYWSTSWSWWKKGVLSEQPKCGNAEIHTLHDDLNDKLP